MLRDAAPAAPLLSMRAETVSAAPHKREIQVPHKVNAVRVNQFVSGLRYNERLAVTLRSGD
jgi:hypothetical protein